MIKVEVKFDDNGHRIPGSNITTGSSQHPVAYVYDAAQSSLLNGRAIANAATKREWMFLYAEGSMTNAIAVIGEIFASAAHALEAAVYKIAAYNAKINGKQFHKLAAQHGKCSAAALVLATAGLGGILYPPLFTKTYRGLSSGLLPQWACQLNGKL